MMAAKVIFICVGAALIASMLRLHRPEIAAMLSLAVGVGVFLMVGDGIQEMSGQIKRILRFASMLQEDAATVLKAAGIAILAELGVQICCDAGENALAGRIRLASRIAMLGLAMPSIARIMDSVTKVIG